MGLWVLLDTTEGVSPGLTATPARTVGLVPGGVRPRTSTRCTHTPHCPLPPQIHPTPLARGAQTTSSTPRYHLTVWMVVSPAVWVTTPSGCICTSARTTSTTTTTRIWYAKGIRKKKRRMKTMRSPKKSAPRNGSPCVTISRRTPPSMA